MIQILFFKRSYSSRSGNHNWYVLAKLFTPLIRGFEGIGGQLSLCDASSNLTWFGHQAHTKRSRNPAGFLSNPSYRIIRVVKELQDQVQPLRKGNTIKRYKKRRPSVLSHLQKNPSNLLDFRGKNHPRPSNLHKFLKNLYVDVIYIAPVTARKCMSTLRLTGEIPAGKKYERQESSQHGSPVPELCKAWREPRTGNKENCDLEMRTDL